MRKSIFAAVAFVITAMFAVSAYAQGGATQTTTGGKVGLVDTGAFFEDKAGAGIPKLKTAVQSVNTEFKPVNDELQTLGTQYQTKVDEFNKLKNSNVPVNDLDARAAAITDLETTIKRKQEDAKAKYDRRTQQVVDPIYADVIKAMSEFAKQKGFAMILDGAKLEQAGVLLGFDEKYDVTKEFITYYNSRPAGAATTAATTTTTPAKP